MKFLARILIALAAILPASTARAEFGMSVGQMVESCIIPDLAQYEKADAYLDAALSAASCFGFVAGVLAAESGTFCIKSKDIVAVSLQITDAIRHTQAKASEPAVRWIRFVIHKNVAFQCSNV